MHLTQLNALWSVGQVLKIPDVRWTPIPPGTQCAPQFWSPYAPTPAPPPALIFTPMFWSLYAPTSPILTFTPMPDQFGPLISKLSVTPNPACYDSYCTIANSRVTFAMTITDPSGVQMVKLWYLYQTTKGVSNWLSVPVPVLSPDSYGTVIDVNADAQAVSAVLDCYSIYSGSIRWYVEATDALGNQARTDYMDVTVNISDTQGDVTIGGDVVGRDKIVNNIQNIYARTLTAVEEPRRKAPLRRKGSRKA